MSNYGQLSIMAYAAVLTWGFWRFMSMGLRYGWDPQAPGILCLMLCALAARVFATVIHSAAMRGQS